MAETIPFEEMNLVLWEDGCRFHRYRGKTWKKKETVGIICEIYCFIFLLMFDSVSLSLCVSRVFCDTHSTYLLRGARYCFRSECCTGSEPTAAPLMNSSLATTHQRREWKWSGSNFKSSVWPEWELNPTLVVPARPTVSLCRSYLYLDSFNRYVQKLPTKNKWLDNICRFRK